MKKKSQEERKFSTKSVYIFAIMVFSLTTILLVGIWAHKLPLGVKGEWEWRYIKEPLSLREAVIPFILIALLLFLLFIFMRNFEKKSRKEEALFLVILFILSLIFQLTLTSLVTEGLQQFPTVIYFSPISGYFTQADREIKDLGNFLANYDVYIAGLPEGHLGAHPPGLAIYYWSLINLYKKSPGLARGVVNLMGEKFDRVFQEIERAAGGRKVGEPQRAAIWTAVFLAMLAVAAAPILLYLLARRISDKKTALFAAAFTAFIPGLFLFSPRSDVLFPAIAITIYLLTLKALKSKSPLWGFFAGLVFFLGAMLRLSFFVISALVVFYLLLQLWSTLREGKAAAGRLLRSWIKPAIGILIGFFLLIIILKFATGFNAFKVWRICYARQSPLTSAIQRTWWKWMLYSPFEFAGFLGIPISAFLLCRLISEVRRSSFIIGRSTMNRKQSTSRSLAWRPEEAYLLSFIVTILLLYFSGKTLSEVGRLWIFLMPFATIPAVVALRELGRRGDFLLLFSLALQGVQVIFFKTYLNVLFIIS